MGPSPSTAGEPAAERFLALLYGVAAALLGACVWSGAAAVFGAWSLAAAPGAGWLTGWACGYGARRSDDVSRSMAWVLGTLGILCGLLAYCAFTVAQASPDSGIRADIVGAEYLGLLSAPPWFGSAAVLLALVGVSRSLRGRPRRPRAVSVGDAVPAPVATGPGLPRGAVARSAAPAASSQRRSRAA